jgi:hypothetical protein
MRTSDQINEIAAALAAAQAEFPVIRKGKTAKIPTKSGKEYSYAYADLADILEAVRPPLNKHGITLQQPLASVDGCWVLRTKITHSSGQFMESDFPLTMNGTIQEVGSEQTYVRRYALCGFLGVAGEEDDDGQNANSNGDRKPQQQRPPQPAATKDTAKEGGAAAAMGMTWHQFCIDAKAIADGRGVSDKAKPALQKFGKSQGIRPIAIPSATLEEALLAMVEDRWDWDDATIRQARQSAA